MKVYRTLWVTVCLPLTVVGLSLGFVYVPVPLTALAVLLGAIAATDVSWAWLSQDEEAKDSLRVRARVIANNAMVVGAATGAVVGFANVLGAGVLLLLILVLTSSPYAVSIYGHWLLSVPTPSVAQLDRVTRALSYASPELSTFHPPLGVGALTDEELCQRWRDSCTALQQQPSSARMAAAAAERQTCLDELERRNPGGFAAWLASGACPSDDPWPYLTRVWVDQPAFNWNELTRGQDW